MNKLQAASINEACHLFDIAFRLNQIDGLHTGACTATFAAANAVLQAGFGTEVGFTLYEHVIRTNEYGPFLLGKMALRLLT